jgi:hypothetical protein
MKLYNIDQIINRVVKESINFQSRSPCRDAIVWDIPRRCSFTLALLCVALNPLSNIIHVERTGFEYKWNSGLYSRGVIKWTQRKVAELHGKNRKTLNIYKGLHPRSDRETPGQHPRKPLCKATTKSTLLENAHILRMVLDIP